MSQRNCFGREYDPDSKCKETCDDNRPVEYPVDAPEDEDAL